MAANGCLSRQSGRRTCFVAALLIAVGGFVPSLAWSLDALTRAAVSSGAVQAFGDGLSLGATLGQAAVVGTALGAGLRLDAGYGGGRYPLLVVETPDSPRIDLRYTNLLGQSFPNPFHASTTIEYTVESPSIVRLVVYDVSGRRVRTLVDTPQLAGPRSVQWDGRDDRGRVASTGIYFYRIDIGSWNENRKMLKVR